MGIPETLAQLRATHASGRTRPLAWRHEQLERMRALLVEREADLLGALASDLAKPPTEAWATDIGFVISEIDHVRRRLRSWVRPERVWTPMVARPGSARLVREPYGVALVIAPWNYPIQLLLSPMVGALAAGNCVVGKPSEVAPATSAVLARLIPKYLDTDAVAIVEGGVAETQALLSERFDYVFYTGNTRVGRIVMEAAAKHLTPVTLELGGKSPVIVDDDTDLEVAARRVAWGKYLNAGQTCIAPDYALVARGSEEQFVEHIRRAVFDFYGSNPQDSADYGRIVNDQHCQRLAGLLDGGRATVGGRSTGRSGTSPRRCSRTCAPTPRYCKRRSSARSCRSLPVDSVDAAIAYVNEHEKPLALYLFSQSSRDPRRGPRPDELGWRGGERDDVSGGGAGPPLRRDRPERDGRLPRQGELRDVRHTKGVFRKATKPDPALAYPPYTPRKDRLMRRFL